MKGKELFLEEINIMDRLLKDSAFSRWEKDGLIIAEWEGNDEVLRFIYKPKS